MHPFYTQNILHFEPKFVGQWSDSDKGQWDIQTFKEVILKENHAGSYSELNDNEKRMYNHYKEGYAAYYTKDSTKTTFLAMPFKIDNQLFLDFTPVEDEETEKLSNGLYNNHLIKTHTLAKVDIANDNEINIKWFSSKKLKVLLDENRIKIKYERVGFWEDILLTASSDELVKFIEKYMSSEDEDKWTTDVEVNLKRNE